MSIRKLKEQSEVPKMISVKMSIDNNTMSTNVQVIEESETERKKPKIISEITLKPAEKVQIKNIVDNMTTEPVEGNKATEEIMFLSSQPIPPETKQILMEQIKTW